MNSNSHTMNPEQEDPARYGRPAFLDNPGRGQVRQPRTLTRNISGELAGAARNGGNRRADPLMSRLMARLEEQAAARAGHSFDLAAGKRRFMAWLSADGDTTDGHLNPPESARSGDRLDASQLGYSPYVTRIQLGTRLRRLRENAGITTVQAAYEIRASSTKISRMELGRTSFKERDIADLLCLYGVTDPQEKDALFYLARQANEHTGLRSYADVLPELFEIYAALEETAAMIKAYDAQHVPDLLQTEDYARVLARQSDPDATDWEIDRRLQMLKKRQAALMHSDAPTLWFLIDEAVLKRFPGDHGLMLDQVRYLAEASTQPGVTIQIVPLSTEAGSTLGGSFTVLRFADHDLPDVVYIKQLTSAVYLERNVEVERYLRAWDRLSCCGKRVSGSSGILGKCLEELSADQASLRRTSGY